MFYVTLGNSMLSTICPIIFIIVIFRFRYESSNFIFDIILFNCFFCKASPPLFIANSYIYKLTWAKLEVKLAVISNLLDALSIGGRMKCSKAGRSIPVRILGYLSPILFYKLID